MNKVYVFNDNDHPLKEMFKGDEVIILAKDYWRTKNGEKKELDIFEANDFRGQYHPVPFDGSGKMINDPRYFKMVKMIPTENAEVEKEETPVFKCMAGGCKHVSPSPEELEAHTTVRHPGVEKLILPEVDVNMKKKRKEA